MLTLRGVGFLENNSEAFILSSGGSARAGKPANEVAKQHTKEVNGRCGLSGPNGRCAEQPSDSDKVSILLEPGHGAAGAGRSSLWKAGEARRHLSEGVEPMRPRRRE